MDEFEYEAGFLNEMSVVNSDTGIHFYVSRGDSLGDIEITDMSKIEELIDLLTTWKDQ